MVKLSDVGVIFIQLYIVILLGATFIESRKNAPLLIEEEGSRRNNRPAECQFGKTLKELGSMWFADLGPPFGVMYCIKCECLPVQKKRRIVARAHCRNIKNECPKPTCDEPILLPGRCCKACPGDTYSPDVVQDVSPSIPSEEEERSMKHFAALLTGRTSTFLKRDDMKSMYSTINPQNIVASARFSFHKKNLYYSFYISDKAKRPRAIQFIDNAGNILEEHSLTVQTNEFLSSYQNTTGKICGVWRSVPRDYRRLLRDDLMYVVLLWGGKYQAELALAGQIGKYPALSTELFSSILEPAPGTNPEQMSGAGGTAIVSTISGSTSSIHITVVFNGVFSSDELMDIGLNVRLESLEKKVKIIDEIQRIKKPAHDINIVEISSPVTANDLRLLSRGRLAIVVESRKKPDALRIQGTITTRIACEQFQTLLINHNADSNIQSSGLAWLYLSKDGSLVYNIQTDKLNNSDHPIITLIDESAKKKTELEDLTTTFGNNYGSGVIDRLGPRVLEPLYSNDLAVNIATEYEPNSLLKGRLVWKPVADSRDSPFPTLLKRASITVPLNIAGMAWLAVDIDCNLHYEITLTGAHNQALQFYMEELPIEAPNAPITRKLLEDFTGNYLESLSLSFTATDLAKLETNVIYLEIYSKEKNEVLLKSKIKPIKVPNHCLPLYTDNDVPNVSTSEKGHKDNPSPTAEKCYHSGRFYDEGGQWSSELESCTMCSCAHGRVKCDAIKCPPIKCSTGESRLLKGECCPSCFHPKHIPVSGNSSKPIGCLLADQFYSPGSSWHPYLPPNGFDECAVCTCNPLTLEIACPRTQCPPLNCSEKEAYRPDKKACCKKCPEFKPVSHEKGAIEAGTQLDQDAKAKPRTEQEKLAEGGCKTPMAIHENGQEWHPVVASHGEQRCVQCRCKDGVITCSRKRCTRSVCNNRINGNKKKSQQQNLDINECCNHQCRRQRRHHQNNKRLRKEKENAEVKTILTKS